MSAEIPQISITHAINGNVSDSSEEENSPGIFPGDLTDVEDFNSHDEVSDGEDFTKLMKSMYESNNSRKQSMITDIEDYVDSASEDEKSEIPDIKISFREFFDNGSIEEELHNADGMKTRSAVKTGKKNLQNILKDDENGQKTDSENYDTTGDDVSEIEDRMINTNLTPYFPDIGSLEMADKIDTIIKKKHKLLNKIDVPELSDASSDKINQTPSDDISDESSNNGDINYSDNDMSYSDADGAIGGAISEVEDLLCSGAEEVINMYDSDTSDIDSDSIYDDYPKIDVKFITTYTKDRPHKLNKPIKSKNNSNCLTVSLTSDGPLTDIEKLDDSQAEEEEEEDSNSDNEDEITKKGILIARAIVSQETQTDSEDFELSNDVLSELLKFRRVSTKLIPPPIRELIKVRENTNGDPITTVEQLNDDIEIGLHDYENEPYKTDEEIFSDNEINPPLLKIETKDLRRNSPIFMENEIIQNYESVKNLTVKRSDNIEEPTTDIEEIFMSGTARRKRSVKSKTSNRNKPQRLSAAKSTSNINEMKTDTEEINLSDFENPKKLTKSISEYQLPSSSTSDAIIEAIQALSIRSISPDPKTDIENFTADEDGGGSSVSDTEQKCPSDAEFLGQENYISTISSRDALTERGLSIIRKPSPIFKKFLRDEECFQSEGNSQCVTDIEDINLTSDIEESTFNRNINDNCNTITAAAKQLNDVLLEGCCNSIVYEKSKNTFDAEKEKEFMKGNQFSDAYTDVEYIEEEIAKETTSEEN